MPHQVGEVQRKRMLRAFSPDIAVLLGSRHRHNSHRLLGGVPYVYDLDDADFHDDRMRERMVRDVSGSIGVLAGSKYIRDWAARYSGNVSIVWTGSPSRGGCFRSHCDRGSTIAWAQTSPLECRGELDFVIGVLELASDGVPAGSLVRFYNSKGGPDELSVARRIRSLGFEFEWLPFMGYRKYLSSLEEAAVGLSPVASASPFSLGKSFGKVLGYLASGVPAIVSDECDHADFFRPDTGIVSNDAGVWSEMLSVLLGDHERRDSMARAAFGSFEAHLSTRAAASKVDVFCRKVLGLSG